MGKEQKELGTETLGKRDVINSFTNSQGEELLHEIRRGVWMERNRDCQSHSGFERSFDSEQPPPIPQRGWAELHLLTLTVIPTSREVAEPFLELSVGLDSLHMRLARLLAARGSDNRSFEAAGRAVGRGHTKKGSSTWLPSSQTCCSPPLYPVQKTESVRKICQRLLTLDKV